MIVSVCVYLRNQTRYLSSKNLRIYAKKLLLSLIYEKDARKWMRFIIFLYLPTFRFTDKIHAQAHHR